MKEVMERKDKQAENFYRKKACLPLTNSIKLI